MVQRLLLLRRRTQTSSVVYENIRGINVDEFIIVEIPECCASMSVLQKGAVLNASMLKAALDGDAVVPGTVLKDELTGEHVMAYRFKGGLLSLARVYDEDGIWLIDEREPLAMDVLAGA